MPYWDIVGRSFAIAWRHKYLWLIAFFSGETAGTNFNFSYQPPERPASVGVSRTPDFAAAQAQITAWIQNNIGLLSLLAVLWLALAIGFFLLAAACEGATIRASAEHDAERPFELTSAWRAGVARMWVIVRFRLILLLLGLPVLVVAGALVVGAVAAAFNGKPALAIALGGFAALLFLVSIPYLVYLSFLDRFGSRAAVLDLVAARAALARAHRLLFKRLGRALLVWLLSIAIALGIGIAIGVVGAVLFLPLIGLIYFAFAGGVSWFWVALVAVIAFPIFLVIAAYFAAQSSTYWTLAFRRMDVEYAPPYAYPPPQVPPA